MELTKDSDRLICLLYKQYLEDRKAGISKDSAKDFGSSEKILERLNLNETLEDLDETMRELDRAGFLDNYYASDTISESRLTDSAIIKMENRFKNGLLGVVEFLSKFIP